MDQTSPACAAAAAAGEVLAEAHRRIADYYTETVSRFGATPRGVDWTCQATQEMRFVQLLKLCDVSAPFSLNDLGCGYGALAGFIARRYPSAEMDYRGVDLSPAMITRAKRRFRGRTDCRFVVGDRPDRRADYTVASGVMNVQTVVERSEWETFVVATLRVLRGSCRLGFAVNFLNASADAVPGLYRTPPDPWVDFCQRAFGGSAEVLQSYGMREFTLLVRPDPAETTAGETTERAATAPAARGRRRAAVRIPPAPVSGSEALRDAAAILVSPEDHADEAKVHAAFRLLRQESPVHNVALPGIRPFWAITRYDDIVAVERKGSGFVAGPRTVLASELVDTSMQQLSGRAQLLRPLTHMDEPDHGPYRAIAQPWFLPSKMAALEAWIGDWAMASVDRIAASGGRSDFATDVAVPFTFRIITRMLGIPEADEPQVDRMLRGLVGAEDPLRRLVEPPGNPVHAALRACRDYFEALAADRQTCPRDDLASVLANACIDGAPLPAFERVSYYVLLAIAGYDTTAFALSGGLHALIEHPEQLLRLQQEPALLDSAIEEILRWTSPSRHFMRTATQDISVRGQIIRAGESVAIFFPSGNRDEAVFTDSDRFRIDRIPNPHIAFGWGPHFCLGQALARMELRALFGALLPRLRGASLTAPPRRAQSVFLTGFTSLPVALTLA